MIVTRRSVSAGCMFFVDLGRDEEGLETPVMSVSPAATFLFRDDDIEARLGSITFLFGYGATMEFTSDTTGIRHEVDIPALIRRALNLRDGGSR